MTTIRLPFLEMKRAVVILAMAIFSLASAVFPQDSGGGKHPDPQWEIDLTKFGYQGRPPVPFDPADSWGYWTYQQGVVFTGPNELAVFFVVHDETSDSAGVNKKPSPSDPYRLVAVFFNAIRGDVIKKLDWPLPPGKRSVPPSFFFPALNGRFVVGIGDTLLLYSPHFELLARYNARQELSPIASPAGDTILLQQGQQINGGWVPRYELLDTEKLSVLKSWSDGRPSSTLWSDEFAWFSEDGLIFKTLDTVPRQLIEDSKNPCGYATFIKKETIAVVECNGPEKLVLVSTGGQVIQEFDMGFEQVDGPPVASRDGRRFAIPSFRWGSGRNVNPERLAARVFNVGEAEPILTLDVQGHSGAGDSFHTPFGDTRFGWGGLALSQDGVSLAIKSGSLVQLYKVTELRVPNEKASAKPGPVAPRATRKSMVSEQQIQQVLSWLPADTETVIAANGPSVLPELTKEVNGIDGDKELDEEIEDVFRGLPLGLFGSKKGIFGKHFEGEKVLLGLEGSRKFQFPSGLGEGPFQGSAFAVFVDDITVRAKEFMEDAETAAIRMEQIEGQKVAVFQEEMENDTWTTFIAFPKPNVAVAASDKEYLADVLARMNGKSGPRALPNALPEWKHVDIRDEFWAVRHFSKKDTNLDPTSPFGGRKAANFPNEKAIGVAFDFDPGKSKAATITYLSGDEKILEQAQQSLFPLEHELGGRELNIRYHLKESGVVEGSFDLEHMESVTIFVIVLEPLLGHAIFM